MPKRDTAARVTVNVPFLNVRMKPDAASAVCGRLESGAVVSLLETTSDGSGRAWGRIGGRKQCCAGWIALDYTQKA